MQFRVHVLLVRQQYPSSYMTGQHPWKGTWYKFYNPLAFVTTCLFPLWKRQFVQFHVFYQATKHMFKVITRNFKSIPFPGVLAWTSDFLKRWLRLIVFWLLPFFFFKFYFIFKLYIIVLVLQISKWIRHRYTCVPHPEPSWWSIVLWRKEWRIRVAKLWLNKFG